MRISTVILAAVGLSAVTAHSIFTTLFIDDVNQGDATCVRMPMDGATSTSPITDLTSNDMTCSKFLYAHLSSHMLNFPDVGGSQGVARVCPAAQGSKLTFQWRLLGNDPKAGSIDPGHKGPCSVYMKKVKSAITDPGHGGGWFKIFDSGYDKATNEWCTEKLVKAKGLLSVNISSELSGGYYLVRPELLSLHAAVKGEPQFYTGCAQIFLDSPETGVPATTVNIPGYVKKADSAMDFDIYTETSQSYPMHGPPVSKFIARRSKAPEMPRVNTLSQIEGLKPMNCVVENGNWIGTELKSYNTELGCWAASKACWAQINKCYDTAAPTGYAGCTAWEAKCEEINRRCEIGDFVGPPNKGKILTPTKQVFDLSIAIGHLAAKAVVLGTAQKPKQQAAKPTSVVVTSVASSPSTYAKKIVTRVFHVTQRVAVTRTAAPRAATPALEPRGWYPPPNYFSAAMEAAHTEDAGVPKMVTRTTLVTYMITVTPTASTKTAAPDLTPRRWGPRPDFGATVHHPGIDMAKLRSLADALNHVSTSPVLACPTTRKRQDFMFVDAPADPQPDPVNLPVHAPEEIAPQVIPVPVPPVENNILFPVLDADAANTYSGISVYNRPIVPTLDGTCGVIAGYKCEYAGGLVQGCCSRYGYCGFDDGFCGDGCQSAFGLCHGSYKVKRQENELLAAKDSQVGSVDDITVTVTPACTSSMPTSHVPFFKRPGHTYTFANATHTLGVAPKPFLTGTGSHTMSPFRVVAPKPSATGTKSHNQTMVIEVEIAKLQEIQARQLWARHSGPHTKTITALTCTVSISMNVPGHVHPTAGTITATRTSYLGVAKPTAIATTLIKAPPVSKGTRPGVVVPSVFYDPDANKCGAPTNKHCFAHQGGGVCCSRYGKFSTS